jgi:hypothetical protein
VNYFYWVEKSQRDFEEKQDSSRESVGGRAAASSTEGVGFEDEPVSLLERSIIGLRPGGHANVGPEGREQIDDVLRAMLFPAFNAFATIVVLSPQIKRPFFDFVINPRNILADKAQIYHPDR